MLPVAPPVNLTPTTTATVLTPQAMSPLVRSQGPSRPTLESQNIERDKKQRRKVEEQEGEVSRLALEGALGRPNLRFAENDGEPVVDAVGGMVGEIEGVPVEVFARQARQAGLKITRGTLYDNYV